MARDDDVSIDIGKLKKLFDKKYAIVYLTILMLLIPLAASVYLRVQPAYLPKADDWARSSIYSTIQQNIRTQIKAQAPNLPDSYLERETAAEFQKVLDSGIIDSNGQQFKIEQVISENADFLRQKFQDDDGQTYLLAIDPWYFYRLTTNAVNYGYQYDFVDEEGKYHDTKVTAGKPLSTGSDIKIREFHVKFQTWLVNIFRIFWPDISVLTVAFYAPVIISALAVVPAFFLTRKIAGNTGGFFAGMIVALHPAYLTRTAGGFSDTDAYNVFFPLFIAWFAMEALDAKSYKNSIIYASLAGLFIGMFSLAWKAWYFIFDFMIATAAIFLGYRIISNMIKSKKIMDKPVKLAGTGFLAFFVSSAFFVFLIAGVSRFSFIKGILDFTQIKAVGTLKIWPNVYTTVAELNPANLNQTIGQIGLGNNLWLIFGLLGLVLPLYIKKNNKSLYFALGSSAWLIIVMLVQRSALTSHIIFGILISLPIIVWILYSLYAKEQIDIKYSVLLVIWFAATIYASSNGVRFILLLVPAFAISAGITVGILWKGLTEMLSKGFSINKTLTGFVFFALFFGLLLVNPFGSSQSFVKAATTTAENEIPSMNDDWFAALDKINQEAEQDAIINSWWDFGHWFAAIGNRSVTLDGGRQNNPQAHWLGKLMLTWEEDESVGILRYLDCGSNTGFDTLTQYTKDDLEAIHILYEIIPLDKQDAKSILTSNGLSESEADGVLKYTHCDAPENYFVTSEDMVGKSGVWAHFGSWDFDRAVMFNQVNGLDRSAGVALLESDFGFDRDDASDMYSEIQNAVADRWIAPWPSYAGASNCRTESSRVVCDNGVIWDLETKDAYLNTQDGRQNPKAFVFVEDGEFNLREYDENVIIFPQTGRPLGVAMLGQNGRYRALLMDSDLTASIFTRLFYYENEDKGLKHFKKFHEVTDVTGQKIIIWKIDWDGIVEEKVVDVQIDSFAKCLKDSGAKMYGTATCPWCNKQKELLGESKNIPYIDCNDNSAACQEAGVTAYPTWVFDDEAVTGFRTIEQIEELSGCSFSDETETGSDTTDAIEDIANVEEVADVPDVVDEEEDVVDDTSEFDLAKVSHILISTEDRTEQEAMALAQEIAGLIDVNSFEELIEEYSECSEETIQCELGWFGRGVLDKDFEDAAFGLIVDQISEPVQSKYGYHIVKLTGAK